MAAGNGHRGLIYIEVPCLDWICSHRAWFDIYYEHVTYFCLSDFQRLFGCVMESGRVFKGQYLYVVADLASLRDAGREPVAPFSFPADFTASIQRFANRIRDRGVPAIVWGAASKGVLFSLFMQRAGAQCAFVVDINPAKQGKYLPVTGLRVSSPEELM